MATVKKLRAGSPATMVKLAREAGMPIALPPGVSLPDDAVPIFNALAATRPRDMWTAADAMMLANLVNLQFEVEAMRRVLREDSMVINTGTGSRKAHPLSGEIRAHVGLIAQLQRQLKIHTTATTAINSHDLRDISTSQRSAVGNAGRQFSTGDFEPYVDNEE